MFDFSYDAMTVKAVVTLLILAAAMYGFVSERFAPDITAAAHADRKLRTYTHRRDHRRLRVHAFRGTKILTAHEEFSGTTSLSR